MNARSSPKRTLLTVLAFAALSPLVFSYFDRTPGKAAGPAWNNIHAFDRFDEHPRVAPIFMADAARLSGSTTDQTKRSVGAYESGVSTPQPVVSSVQPARLQFKFLGKTTAQDKTVILLYGGGRNLTVRGTGPVDDDYAVDAIEEDCLVLRKVATGEQYVVELTSQAPDLEKVWSGEDPPQD